MILKSGDAWTDNCGTTSPQPLNAKPYLSDPPDTTRWWDQHHIGGPPVISPEEVKLAEKVIARRDVHTVFQPVVYLATGEVIGFEALSRGPIGSPLESPLTLLAAAGAAGLLEELDWVCCASAARAVVAARLHPSMTILINMEPSTLATRCPDDLVVDVTKAREQLRVVAELAERSLLANPGELLNVIARIRETGWGVSIDNFGGGSASLALLPFIHPDVIKLDLRLLAHQREQQVAEIANAVRAHAERTGAVVLAEGIETDDQAMVARALGASFGQGWRYGEPGGLPAETRAPLAPFRLLRAPDMESSATPFDIVGAQRPTSRTEKHLLVPMSRYLENQALMAGAPVVVLACFQRERNLTTRVRAWYEKLARSAVFTAVLGAGIAPDTIPGVRATELAREDRLYREWNVLVVGPHYAGALVARDCGDDGDDMARRFDYVITHDRDLVVSAARGLLHWINAVPLG